MIRKYVQDGMNALERFSITTKERNMQSTKVWKNHYYQNLVLVKNKMNKAAALGETVREIMVLLNDLGIDKATEMINEISDISEIPEDLGKSIFIVMPNYKSA